MMTLRTKIVTCGVLAAVASAVYASTLRDGFISEDWDIIVSEPRLREIGGLASLLVSRHPKQDE